MIGADIIAESFVRHGLNRVYTFPGGTLAPIYDACQKQGIDLFCSRHEQGAGYAALAIARLTHVPQVVMVTSGPGVTNLVTPVADAYFDSTPLVAITGQVGTGDIKSGRLVRQSGFQQVDTVSLMKPIAKAVFLPMSPDDLYVMLEEAFSLASEGRQGPVVIDIPMDVQRGIVDLPSKRDVFKPIWEAKFEKRDIQRAAEWLAAAKRPVILAGQGVLLSEACSELRELAESYGIPVVTSLLGLGAMPSDSPLSLGFVGHTGNQYAGHAIHSSDCLLVVGARLDLRQTGTLPNEFVLDGKVIRIDLDHDEIEYSRVRSDLNIQGDAKAALKELLSELRVHSTQDLSSWGRQIAEWKTQYRLSCESEELLKPQGVVQTVDELTKGKNTVVVSGVGSHQQWAARHFTFDYPNRVWLTSGGHGAMGYDLPTAIGAQIARPKDLVICFVGDGSIQINIQELQTVVSYATPIKIFVMDNRRLGLVSQFQLLNWTDDPTTGHKDNPDFAAIARAYGIQAYTVEKPSELSSAAKEALAHDGPAMVHCIIDYNEDVSPMLLAGQTVDRMWPNG